MTIWGSFFLGRRCCVVRLYGAYTLRALEKGQTSFSIGTQQLANLTGCLMPRPLTRCAHVKRRYAMTFVTRYSYGNRFVENILLLSENLSFYIIKFKKNYSARNDLDMRVIFCNAEASRCCNNDETQTVYKGIQRNGKAHMRSYSNSTRLKCAWKTMPSHKVARSGLKTRSFEWLPQCLCFVFKYGGS